MPASRAASALPPARCGSRSSYVARLAADSSNRIPKWLVPVINEQLAAGRPVALSAAIVASWARYAEGVDESGEPIEVVDQFAEELVPLARSQARTAPSRLSGSADLRPSASHSS